MVAPRLVDVAWRTDVAISTDSMARLMQPSLLVRGAPRSFRDDVGADRRRRRRRQMQLTTADGKVRSFAVAPEQLDELRFGVAKLLAELSNVENLNVLKLTK